MSLSPFEAKRKDGKPTLSKVFKDIKRITLKSAAQNKTGGENSLKRAFPYTFGRAHLHLAKSATSKGRALKIGFLFSGGQAPGGHNVAAGLFDAIKALSNQSKLIGFLGGPSGLIEGKTKEITSDLIKNYRNMGGFDLIGSGRTKIESKEQFLAAYKTCKKLSLDALVIIGGDDSNTNAAFLAEYFTEKKLSTAVIGVPKTIDGDLQSKEIEISFGFDTACSVYSELIGNIERDALSAKKYYHFIRLMGRSASHIALECALKTQPNLTLISEEVAQKKMTLHEIVDQIATMITKRAESKKNYGVILIPEGLIEFIPEMKDLIASLNNHLAKGSPEKAVNRLSAKLKKTFLSLPKSFQEELLLDRDPHGNVQVSKISTEALLAKMVKAALHKKKSYKGKFNPVTHFLGYEGRAAAPTEFDATYCYNLGYLAALLAKEHKTGYIVSIQGLQKTVASWKGVAIPITSMMNLEMRHGKKKAVIKKTLVNLKGKPFLYFQKHRNKWAQEDLYLFPGPRQFWGPKEISFAPPIIINI